MWQLGLEESWYPERPGEPDCIYFLRTGFCGYADRCRFNHPRHRTCSAGVGSGRGGGGGQPICQVLVYFKKEVHELVKHKHRIESILKMHCVQYYMRSGSCKFGTGCKYHHPPQAFALNIYGYPLRPGEKECSYYMKTGQCKFGMSCKYHHPHPSSKPTPPPYGVVPVASPSMPYIQPPYAPMLFSPAVLPFPTWGPYPGTTSMTTPNTQSMGAGQFYGLMPLSPSAPAYSGPYQGISSSATSNIPKEHSYPQRPGQPECQHYLKTGDCKFGSSCKYHHPTEWVAPETSSTLSSMGLPLRPGTPTCNYYAQHGVCKFGLTCKFDHPMGTLSYSPSTSSLSDMPVAPYPVGSSIGTLAPSSSSSDLRAEVMTGSKEDGATTLSSSVSISSGSGGSLLSKSGSISQSDRQHSSQSSASATLGSSKGGAGHGGAPS